MNVISRTYEHDRDVDLKSLNPETRHWGADVLQTCVDNYDATNNEMCVSLEISRGYMS